MSLSVNRPRIELPWPRFATSEDVRIRIIVDGVDETRRELRAELLPVEEKAEVVDVVVGDAVNARGNAKCTVRCAGKYRILVDEIGLSGQAAEPK